MMNSLIKGMLSFSVLVTIQVLAAETPDPFREFINREFGFRAACESLPKNQFFSFRQMQQSFCPLGDPETYYGTPILSNVAGAALAVSDEVIDRYEDLAWIVESSKKRSAELASAKTQILDARKQARCISQVELILESSCSLLELKKWRPIFANLETNAVNVSNIDLELKKNPDSIALKQTKELILLESPMLVLHPELVDWVTRSRYPGEGTPNPFKNVPRNDEGTPEFSRGFLKEFLEQTEGNSSTLEKLIASYRRVTNQVAAIRSKKDYESFSTEILNNDLILRDLVASDRPSDPALLRAECRIKKLGVGW